MFGVQELFQQALHSLSVERLRGLEFRSRKGDLQTETSNQY